MKNKINHISEYFVWDDKARSPSPLMWGLSRSWVYVADCSFCLPHFDFDFRLHQSVQHQVSRMWFSCGSWRQVYWSPGPHLAWHLLHLCGTFLAESSSCPSRMIEGTKCSLVGQPLDTQGYNRGTLVPYWLLTFANAMSWYVTGEGSSSPNDYLQTNSSKVS